MPFQETFKDLRARRRIPMRLFKERVGVSPSYIHSIEREGFVPSAEKLTLLASVFVEVAGEQEAKDPEADARILFRERNRAELIDRLEFDPELADLLLFAREMDVPKRAALMPALWDALAIYTTIDDQERGGVATLIARVRKIVEAHDPETRGALGSELAARIGAALDEIEAAERQGSSTPEHEYQAPA